MSELAVEACPPRDLPGVAFGFLARYGTLVAFILMCTWFSVAKPDIFPTTENFVSILNQVALLAVIAGGLTIALAAGEFDLSIGWVASFSGVLATGLMAKQGWNLWIAMLATVLVTASIGLVAGLIVTKAGVTSFITTLGLGTIIIGLNFAYNSGFAVTSGVPASFSDFSLKRLGSIPAPVFVAAGVLVVLWVLLNLTVFGQNVRAVGGNKEAARLSGINVDRVRILAMMISGGCAGIGGILLASKLGSAQTTAGDGFLLDAFAAAFLGSVALRDGEFHVTGTVIGVLTVGVGFNGLAIFGLPTFYQYLFKGGLLVVAVGISTIARRFATR